MAISAFSKAFILSIVSAVPVLLKSRNKTGSAKENPTNNLDIFFIATSTLFSVESVTEIKSAT
ncbi:hypothetical protein D035_4282 [Vibrio parahaemolyticus VP250]|nr:hypothetical protein D035_4282 [Vibrio parahaemolyticus VP250]